MEIKTFSPVSQKLKVLIYGPSGAGKTRFAATAPNPIFASAEAGLLSTVGTGKKIDYAAIRTLEDLKELLTFLQRQDHKYETVVIDSITEINEIIKEGIEEKNNRGMQLQDWGTLQKQIKELLRDFRSLDMHVIFIAQETVQQDDAKITKILPSLNGKSATEIAYFMDIVGYAYIDKNNEHKISVIPQDKYLTKDRSERIQSNVPDFTMWIESVEAMPIGEEEIKFVEGEVRIDDTQRAKIFAKWNKLVGMTPEMQEKPDEYRKAALDKYFKKRSVMHLTQDEAEEFANILQEKIDEKIKTVNEAVDAVGGLRAEEDATEGSTTKSKK